MPKLPRVTVVQYGSTGPTTDFGQFGSKTALAPQTSKNPSVIQQLSAWVTGWTAAAVGAAFNPYLEDMNGAFFVFGYFLANIFERGIPDWDAGTTYYRGAVVQDPAGSGQQWYSLTDNNLNNAPPLLASNAQWQWNNAPQIPAGTSLDFMGIIIPQGFLAEDGSARSRVTFANLFAALSVTTSGTLTPGQPQITGISTTANLQPGFFISGTGIPSGAKILSVDSGSQVTMTMNASGSGAQTLVFAPWGIGDGATTFNLPDTRRRVAVGAGGAGNSVLANVLGATGGEDSHTLTIPEMPAHTHNESHSSNNTYSPQASSANTPSSFTPQPTSSTGGGGAHNNIQQSYVVTKIIKT